VQWPACRIEANADEPTFEPEHRSKPAIWPFSPAPRFAIALYPSIGSMKQNIVPRPLFFPHQIQDWFWARRGRAWPRLLQTEIRAAASQCGTAQPEQCLGCSRQSPAMSSRSPLAIVNLYWLRLPPNNIANGTSSAKQKVSQARGKLIEFRSPKRNHTNSNSAQWPGMCMVYIAPFAANSASGRTGDTM
jgi:hypothetical protein